LTDGAALDVFLHDFLKSVYVDVLAYPIVSPSHSFISYLVVGVA
jgi:hypothetical protein